MTNVGAFSPFRADVDVEGLSGSYSMILKSMHSDHAFDLSDVYSLTHGETTAMHEVRSPLVRRPVAIFVPAPIMVRVCPQNQHPFSTM
jgi:hypothetical protein